ncbi:putative Isoleucyl-tRNA synthetase [Candidatus Zixiibacteriota bacterium]|nr:putative Isoleucyl-tRNA synthetase [candidate division Zixibacteria bacterium]
MKIDLHIHTSHSFDSESSIESVLGAASRAGLDAVAICDHDTMSATGLARMLAPDIVIIPGMELTTDRGTHIIGLFLEEEVVARDILGAMAEIHEQQGLVMIPHPYRPNTGLWHNRDRANLYSGEEIEKIISQVDLIEAVNFHSQPEEILDTDRHLRLLTAMPQGAGSDAHSIDDIGKAYVDLDCDRTDDPEDLKKALLRAPRLLRFEAYSQLEGTRTLSITPPSPQKALMKKTREIIESILPGSWRNSARHPEREELGATDSDENQEN